MMRFALLLGLFLVFARARSIAEDAGDAENIRQLWNEGPQKRLGSSRLHLNEDRFNRIFKRDEFELDYDEDNRLEQLARFLAKRAGFTGKGRSRMPSGHITRIW